MSDHASSLLDAMSRLPVFRGITWRAANFELTAPFTTDAPIPTTQDLRVATQNFRVAGVHMFLVSGGRDVSPFSAAPSDREVVLLPGARLVPASAFRDHDGLRVQVIIEQPAPGEPIPPVPDDATLAALIAAARDAPDVTVSAPSRFGP